MKQTQKVVFLIIGLICILVPELEQSDQTGKLSIEALTEEFKKARQLFRSGELDQIEQPLNLFLEKVLVFPDYVEIYINNVPVNLKESENEDDKPTVSTLENFQVVTRPEAIQKECVFPIHADYLIKLNTNTGTYPEEPEKSEKITRVRNNSNSSNYGGAEGNRTPVRKQLGKNFSGCSLLFTFPQPGGNKHPTGIGSFIMHGTGKAYCTHGLHSNHTRTPARGPSGEDGRLIRQPEQR